MVMKYSSEDQKVINKWLTSVGAKHLVDEEFFEYREGQLLEIAKSGVDSLLTWDEWQHLQTMMDMEIPLKMSIRFVGILWENDIEVLEMNTDKSKEYEEKWRKNISATTNDFIWDEETGKTKVSDNEKVIVGGMITDKTIKYTKNNKTMAFLTLEDLLGTVEVIVFPRDYERYHTYLNVDEKIFVSGHANVEEDKNGKIICEKIYGFDDTKKELWMQFATKEEYQQMEQKLFRMLLSSDGNDQVVIYLSKEKAIKRLANNRNVHIEPQLLENLRECFGEDNVKVVEKPIENRTKRD